MVEVLGSGQAADVVVPVAAVVAGALDLGKVGHLMDDGRALILSVAGFAEGGQAGEEQVAVGLDAQAGNGVGNDAGAARAVDVGAVQAGVAAGG